MQSSQLQSWACSAGLKNTVPADCCERKILFWQDVNSDFVSGETSQTAGFKPAEHANHRDVLAAGADSHIGEMFSPYD